MRRVALVAIVIFAAACGSGHTSIKVIKGSNTSTTTTTTSAKQLMVGDTAILKDGAKVIVHAYEQPATGLNQYITPQTAGDIFVAIDAEGCAGSNAGSNIQINPFWFNLKMPDNTRVQPSIGAKNPALNATPLTQQGDCARGWVTFEVPSAQRAAQVVFDANTSNGPVDLRWTVPAT